MALRRLGLIVALVAARSAQAEPVDRWQPEIAEASLRFGVPEPWIRQVIRAESGGATRLGGRPIVSPKGAMGLMQLMPATWRAMRSRLGLGTDPFQPRDNILAGTAYLGLLYDRFGYPGLFAAYNAGPARYAAHLAGTRGLPTETLAYLRRVSAAISTAHGVPARGSPLFVALRTMAADSVLPIDPGTAQRSDDDLFLIRRAR